MENITDITKPRPGLDMIWAYLCHENLLTVATARLS